MLAAGKNTVLAVKPKIMYALKNGQKTTWALISSL